MTYLVPTAVGATGNARRLSLATRHRAARAHATLQRIVTLGALIDGYAARPRGRSSADDMAASAMVAASEP